MKRIIKFRAWTGEKMLYPEDRDMKFEPNDLFNKLFYRPMSALLGDSNDYIWMQFTGLTDKNGKEIYEGDIVKDNSIKNRGNTLVIIWNAKYMSFVGRREFGNNTYWDCELYDSLEKELEVIGNIYENKDLLK